MAVFRYDYEGRLTMENQVNLGRAQSKRSCTYLSMKELLERELTHYNMYRIWCRTVKTDNKSVIHKANYQMYTSVLDDFVEAHRSTLTLAFHTIDLGLLW